MNLYVKFRTELCISIPSIISSMYLENRTSVIEGNSITKQNCCSVIEVNSLVSFYPYQIFCFLDNRTINLENRTKCWVIKVNVIYLDNRTKRLVIKVN